jgi:hypothetical protein
MPRLPCSGSYGSAARWRYLFLHRAAGWRWLREQPQFTERKARWNFAQLCHCRLPSQVRNGRRLRSRYSFRRRNCVTSTQDCRSERGNSRARQLRRSAVRSLSQTPRDRLKLRRVLSLNWIRQVLFHRIPVLPRNLAFAEFIIHAVPAVFPKAIERRALRSRAVSHAHCPGGIACRSRCCASQSCTRSCTRSCARAGAG